MKLTQIVYGKLETMQVVLTAKAFIKFSMNNMGLGIKYILKVKTKFCKKYL